MHVSCILILIQHSLIWSVGVFWVCVKQCAIEHVTLQEDESLLVPAYSTHEVWTPTYITTTQHASHALCVGSPLLASCGRDDGLNPSRGGASL